MPLLSCWIAFLVIRVIRKVTLSLGLLFTPFQWYKQGSRVIIVDGQEGAVKIYVCRTSGGAEEEGRKDGMKLSLPPKLVEKLVWV